jgi:lipoprotein-releasing system ATP-binding protein
MPGVLELSFISKNFAYVEILRGVDLKIKNGESVALVGESGSGKSTLLHIAALLDRPSSGDVIIENQKTDNLDDSERTCIRRKNIGFVYQFHNLLDEFNAIENVMLPLIISGNNRKDASETAEILLVSIGLKDRLLQYPKKLSGGEQQRVAIARALVIKPNIIIADEPTGNLDNKTSYQVFEMFLDLIQNKGMALFMATHNMELANMLQRIVSLKDGQLWS